MVGWGWRLYLHFILTHLGGASQSPFFSSWVQLFEADTSEAQTEHADSTFFQGNICGPIAATMNEAMFQLVVTKWRYAFEGLKETGDFKFLSAAGSLMKNMVITSLSLIHKFYLSVSLIFVSDIFVFSYSCVMGNAMLKVTFLCPLNLKIGNVA